MKANVILITYNQEKDIAQALESILMQRTDFEFNIIVADDCSTDNTLSIIQSYAEKSDIEFKFLPQTSNLGYIKNYQRVFAACNADYVAIMEGDDYWTTPNHLQNHIGFLENHPECSMSYNRHLRVFVDQNREEVFDWNSDEDYEYITTERLALGNCIGNFSCCVYRGELIQKLDPRLFDMHIADWMIGMYMGQYGKLAYLKEVTSAYRIHDNGQWSRMSEQEQAKRVISMIEVYDSFFEYKYTESFTRHKKRLEICLYGDKSLRGRIKSITPSFIRKIYRKIIG